MKSNILTSIATLVVVAAIAAVIEWLFGPAAGGAALLVLAIAIGTYLGAGWGGESATKTEEYRQNFIGKRNPQTTYYDDDDDESTSEPGGTKSSP